jgi:hypothetical protein
MDKVSVQLRPDHCKVVFEKVNDHIFFGTQDHRSDMTAVAKKQIGQFNRQGFSVIINTLNRTDLFLAPGHTQTQIKQEFNHFVKDRDGRT